MSNPNEGYAFITNQGWTDHLQDRFPDAISVGDNYRMIQFVRADERGMVEFAEVIGISEKRLSADQTVSAMEALQQGLFIVYGDDVHRVVDHFNLNVNLA